MGRKARCRAALIAIIGSLCCPLAVQAAPNGSVVYELNDEAGMVSIYSDGSIIFTNEDTAATSGYRYRTLGFCVTRIVTDNMGRYIPYRDANGNRETIEFSLTGAQVQLDSVIKNGKVFNTWTIPGDYITGLMSEEWQREYNLLISGNIEEFRANYMIALDSIMTTVYVTQNGELYNGMILDSGTGEVNTFGLVYMNSRDTRCAKCDHDAMFDYTLRDGYSTSDANQKQKNNFLNERICYDCEGYGTGRQYMDGGIMHYCMTPRDGELWIDW